MMEIVTRPPDDDDKEEGAGVSVSCTNLWKLIRLEHTDTDVPEYSSSGSGWWVLPEEGGAGGLAAVLWLVART